MNITLINGLTIGSGDDKQTYHDVIIRELNAGDMIDADAASERVVETSRGPALVKSPSKMTYELMRRAIKKIGPIEGPISMSELRKLSTQDLAQLDEKIFAYQEIALSEALDAKGR